MCDNCFETKKQFINHILSQRCFAFLSTCHLIKANEKEIMDVIN